MTNPMICQRTACADRPVHDARRHRDPRDELYDGPDNELSVLPCSVRDSARRIVREAPRFTPEVIDMAREIQRLGKQVAHVQVDAERRVHDAHARAESCEQHGKDIADLSRQVYDISRQADRTDAARVVLVGYLQGIRDFVRAYREGLVPELTVGQLIDRLERTTKKAAAAHMRAWKKE